MAVNATVAEKAAPTAPEKGASNADKEFIKTLAQEMAQAQGIAMADALAHVKGVVTRRPKRPEEWPKRPVPDRCPPGYAVICDDGGNNPKMIQVFMVAKDSRGTQVHEMEKTGDPQGPGTLWPQVEAKQLIVAHYTPVPNTNADGAPVMVRGSLRYPHEAGLGVKYEVVKDGPEPWSSSFYHPVYGKEYRERATARKG